MADHTQKLQIWRYMYSKNQFSSTCVKQFYFSNVTWSNIILDTHHLNHIFITLNFEQTELSNPDKLMCIEEATVPSRKRKNATSAETTPRMQQRKRRKRDKVLKMRARYIAKRAERRRKMMTLGYPVDTADESEANRQDFLQRLDHSAPDSSSEQPAENMNDDNIQSDASEDDVGDEKSGHGSSAVSTNENPDINAPAINADNGDGLGPSHDFTQHSTVRRAAGTSDMFGPSVSDRVRNWVYKSPEPMEQDYDGDSLPDKGDGDNQVKTVVRGSDEIENENETETDEPITTVAQKSRQAGTPETSSPSSPSPIISPAQPGRSRVPTHIDDSNVTVRQPQGPLPNLSQESKSAAENPQRQSGVSDGTNLSYLDSVVTGEECLMSTQELLNCTMSSIGDIRYDDNAQDGK